MTEPDTLFGDLDPTPAAAPARATPAAATPKPPASASKPKATPGRTAGASGYGADSIDVLEGLAPVRKRPGMYIGNTDTGGRTHLAYEIVDNSVDEALAGEATRVDVTVHPDGSVEVSDDGRGIPVERHKTGPSTLEVVLTTLHAGGKFNEDAYKTAGGLHGVGSSVVNALSDRLDATVVRDGRRHAVSFRRGTPGVFDGPGPDARFAARAGLTDLGKAPRTQHGTTIRYWVDPTIFSEDSVTDTDALRARLRQTAFLVPGLTLVWHDLRDPAAPVEETHRYDGGLADLVAYLQPDPPAVPPVRATGRGQFTKQEDGKPRTRDVEVDVVLSWGTGYAYTQQSYVNVVRTGDGGAHLNGMEAAVAETMAGLMKNVRGLPKTQEPVTFEDLSEGLTAVVSVRLPEPEFVGQTKDRLGNAPVRKIVLDTVAAALTEWATKTRTKADARLVMEKAANASNLRTTARAHKEAGRKTTGGLSGTGMPAKLVDCRSRDTARNELWLLEGDSAASTSKEVRDPDYQALLPLRGVILNVEKANLTKVLANSECQQIIQVLGAGSGHLFDLEQARYARVLLAVDADTAGSHIRALLITLFYRFMRPYVDAGRVFAAMPPLHRIDLGGRSPEVVYTYTQEQMVAVVERARKAGRTVETGRFKGLGRWTRAEFGATTMNPTTRNVRRITVEDADLAEAHLTLLMGEAVEPRREWLLRNGPGMSREDVDA